MPVNALKVRTDLALESAQAVKASGTGSELPDGVELSSSNEDGLLVTDVLVKTADASNKIGKPIGRYITLEPELPLDTALGNAEAAARVISRYLSELLGEVKKDENVLVVGLGNYSITPDSLGPRVSEHIFATRHIRISEPELFEDGMGSVCSIIPGVMGETGLEPQELILPLLSEIKFDALIAVDALACANAAHLGRTIQLTDTGISPGSGVLNKRKELSRATTGIRTIAIGVPTIADAGGEGEPLMITPKNIDKLISTSASLLSDGINMCLHKGFDLEELRLLTS